MAKAIDAIAKRPLSKAAALLGAILMLLAPGLSRAEIIERMDVGELTSAAEAVIIGQVKAKDSKFADGLIQTHYTISVSQTLKGKAASEIQMTVAGGVVEGLPFKQKLDGQPTLFKGEKVLLFLGNANNSKAMLDLRARKSRNVETYRQKLQDEGKPAPNVRMMAENHPLRTSMGFVGGWQGRYTIFTDEASGREFATQVGSTGGMDVENEESMQAFRVMMQRRQDAAAKTEGDAQAAPAAVKSDEQLLEQFLAPKPRRERAIELDFIRDQVRMHVAKDSNKGKTVAPAPQGVATGAGPLIGSPVGN